jgi:glutamine amidotransferase
MGYRCFIANNSKALAKSDLLLLPGGGAFPKAMLALHALELTEFICQQALSGKPLVGICLGMQLLADSSSELGVTAGLGLIPGNVLALSESRWHIGWNRINVVGGNPLLIASDRQMMYFNHSYVLDVSAKYQIAAARIDENSEQFTIGAQLNNVVGLQFHPEKSQTAGRHLLASVIEGLCRA